MKNFSTFLKENAQDYVVPKKKDTDEKKGFATHSKGEEDFKNLHKVKVTEHPVAKDNQFKSTSKETNLPHDGYDETPGERKSPEQGTSKLKSFSAFGKQSKTEANRNAQGETNPIKQGSSDVANPIKEEIEDTFFNGLTTEKLKEIAASNFPGKEGQLFVEGAKIELKKRG